MIGGRGDGGWKSVEGSTFSELGVVAIYHTMYWVVFTGVSPALSWVKKANLFLFVFLHVDSLFYDVYKHITVYYGTVDMDVPRFFMCGYKTLSSWISEGHVPVHREQVTESQVLWSQSTTPFVSKWASKSHWACSQTPSNGTMNISLKVSYLIFPFMKWGEQEGSDWLSCFIISSLGSQFMRLIISLQGGSCFYRFTFSIPQWCIWHPSWTHNSVWLSSKHKCSWGHPL